MNKTILISLSALALTAVATSCEEEEEYIAPQGMAIVLKPNPCAPGDTVRAELTYADAGANWYWYKTTSFFTTPSKKIVEYTGSSSENGFCTFIAPDNSGTYNVGFSGQITITVGKNLWGDHKDCTTQLVVK